MARIKPLVVALILFLIGHADNASAAKKPTYQSDVASFHFTPISITTWDKVLAELQPTFSLSAEAARAAAIPKTTDIQEIYSRKSGFALKFGNDGLREIIDNVTDHLDPTQNKQTTAVKTTQPSDDGSASPSLPADLLAKLALEASNNSRGINQATSYASGTALYQEVKLINRYLQDAAMRHGYTPYVLRFSVTPRIYQPIPNTNVYSRMSFFPSWKPLIQDQWFEQLNLADDDCQFPEARTLEEQQEQITNQKESPKEKDCSKNAIYKAAKGTFKTLSEASVRQFFKNLSQEAKEAEKENKVIYGEPAIVMPLLVTEASELADVNKQMQALRSTSLDILDIISGGTFSGGYTSAKGKGSTRQVNDINNTFSVSRATDGLLELKLGASFDEKSKSVPDRHYYVTVVVLIDNEVLGPIVDPNKKSTPVVALVEGTTRIRMSAYTTLKTNSLRKKRRGAAIYKTRSRTQELQALEAKILSLCPKRNDLNTREVEKAEKYILNNNYRAFHEHWYYPKGGNIGCRNNSNTNKRSTSSMSAWLQLSAEISKREFTYADFQLPVSKIAALPEPRHAFLLRETGKQWKVNFQGAKNIDPKAINASLNLNTINGIVSLSGKASPNSTLGGFDVSFASPTSIGMQGTSVSDIDSVKLTTSQYASGKKVVCNNANSYVCEQTYSNFSIAQSPPTKIVKPTVFQEHNVIFAKDHHGSSAISVAVPKDGKGKLVADKVVVKIDHATIDSVAAATASGTKSTPAIFRNSVTVNPNTRLVFALKNLDKDKNVAITVTMKKGKKTVGNSEQLSFSVMEIKKPSK